jgi:RNA polymerase sigma factor (sigma-70 family)
LESYTTEEIIAGLRQQTPNILRFIYLTYFPEFKKFVLKSNGSEEDAKDCFQESLVIAYRKIKESDSSFIQSFPDYLFGICRHVYLKQKSKDQAKIKELNEYTPIDSTEVDDREIQKNYEYRLYQHHFNRLGEVCRKILDMILRKVPVKEIAALMKTTEGYIQTRKYKCKEQLISNIKNDPNFGKRYEE